MIRGGVPFKKVMYKHGVKKNGKIEGTCAINAISRATKTPALKVRKELCKLQGKNPRKFYRSTEANAIRKYMDDNLHGWVPPTMTMEGAIITKGTIGSFVKNHPTGRFVVNSARHTTCVIDGVLYDEYDCSRERVTEWFRVEDGPMV